ncbi:PREDICTED: cell cycle control protein 50A-like isoform X1 [Branchiostoma belcheri]|uniref:Cell cycle control protein n=1 Tax=Branchiostoma belcheri TaxID=7741 RepID=A0A6P4YV58_BRABE|nr:PREDICTED: cell cycle control protein 50A-like isoform X1 [Branchiostoma belcheri]
MSAEGTRSVDKKPRDTAFKQQRLPAWQPIMTAGTVLPAFYGVGLLFIPIGIGLLVTSNNVQEIVVDYTNCKASGANQTCAQVVQNVSSPGTCVCQVDFTISTDITGSVYMYYGLTNFFQNHRRYVKSRDDDQLLGMKQTKSSLNTDCKPYDGETINGTFMPYAPCGAIANSLFSDTLTLSYGSTPVGLINTGIAWWTDKNVKFRNPTGSSLQDAFSGTLKPKYWQSPVYELDSNNPDNNGYLNEDLIVWMRTAAFPTFRKLYRRVNHTDTFQDGLPAGNYTLTVDYKYPVTAFDGTKRMILSTVSWLGGKNSFLGIAYIVVGCICLVVGLVFTIIHIKYGKNEDGELAKLVAQQRLGTISAAERQ